jgi:maltose O-acetyltransferase
MPQKMWDFLKDKLATTSWRTILSMELESWLQTLCLPWPGIIGFGLRNLLFSTLLKAKRGMVWIQPNVRFVHCERISMGSNCGINSGTYINGLGSITMGDHVLIGSNVTISSGRHPIEGCMPPVFMRPCEPMAIVIEDDVWIGAGAVIMPGITLKKGTVVGANAVVTRSTEEYAIVVGAPARVIRYRERISHVGSAGGL